MTDDEIITRFHRMEAKQRAAEALLLCVLPATDPALRPRVLKQFAQYCQGTEREADAGALEPGVARLQLQALADLYQMTEGALKVIAEFEAKKTKER